MPPIVHNDSDLSRELHRIADQLITADPLGWGYEVRREVIAALRRQAEVVAERYMAWQPTPAERLAWQEERERMARFPVGG